MHSLSDELSRSGLANPACAFQVYAEMIAHATCCCACMSMAVCSSLHTHVQTNAIRTVCMREQLPTASGQQLVQHISVFKRHLILIIETHASWVKSQVDDISMCPESMSVTVRSRHLTGIITTVITAESCRGHDRLRMANSLVLAAASWLVRMLICPWCPTPQPYNRRWTYA